MKRLNLTKTRENKSLNIFGTSVSPSPTKRKQNKEKGDIKTFQILTKVKPTVNIRKNLKNLKLVV
jgi:hypothetical protein